MKKKYGSVKSSDSPLNYFNSRSGISSNPLRESVDSNVKKSKRNLKKGETRRMTKEQTIDNSLKEIFDFYAK